MINYKAENSPLDLGILQYWETRKLLFPLLYDIAQKLLCIPATTVSSERVFSEAKHNIFSCTRTSLTPLKLEQIIVVNSYLNKNDSN